MARRARPGFARATPDPAPADARPARVPALALLPLRVFLGVTFVYAGLDKLLDPNFFNPESPGSIQAQFIVFERVSPLAPLIHLAEPVAPLLGVLIALGEIAVGLGALTGLAFRLAALGGGSISLLFFLTASWATHPYYFGNDLPYAFGWLTLALAGHGDLLVVPLARRTVPAAVGPAAAPLPGERLVSRRNIVQVGALAGLTLLVGGAAGALRLLLGIGPTGGRDNAGERPSPSPARSHPEPTPTASATPTLAPGIAVATVAQVSASGARRFTVPITAPPPLPAGDPGLVILLDDGSFVAYDATCTHEGCRVGWDAATATLVCPCHGAQFDAAQHGAVLAGPTNVPLVELPLLVNEQDGTISLAIS